MSAKGTRRDIPVQLSVSAAHARASRNGRRRALVLLLVHVIIAIHVAHWLITGRTMAPFELNESMFTLEQGAITVGAILMGLILLSVLLFGRFFCSWGCHILALQDGAAWLLARVGIRPRPIRSRLAPLVAITVALSMFVWPQVVRIASGTAWPGLRVTSDSEGLGSLVTSDFLRNLPGPWTTIVTFLTCGGVIVWLLGSRSFCRAVCPYGAVFAGVDRLSIGGIRLTGSCDECGLCTAECSSHIRVHEEISRHGRVVSPNCLKDLDCVKVCPRNALSWGFGRPSLLASLREWRHAVNPWPWREEILFLVVAAACTPIFRSLYGEVPFFLAIAMAVIIGWIAVVTLRVLTLANVRAVGLQLRRAGEVTEHGVGWLVISVCAAALVWHSGWYRWHEAKGREAWAACQAAVGRGTAAEPVDSRAAVEHLTIVLSAGLWSPPYAHRMLADVHLASGRPDLALPHVRRMTELWPDIPERWVQLAQVLDATGDADGAQRALAHAGGASGAEGATPDASWR